MSTKKGGARAAKERKLNTDVGAVEGEEAEDKPNSSSSKQDPTSKDYYFDR
jgi:hypothetical protein